MKRPLTAIIAAALALAVAATVVATAYQLLTQGSYVQIGDAVYRAYNPVSASGSGVFDAFVRVGGKGAIRGYNTDGTLEFETKDGLTRAVLLSEVPLISDPDYPIAGNYREVQLDINQTKGANLSLDEVEFYLTNDPTLSGYPFTGAADKIYELDAAGNDHYVELNYDLAAGSGKRDLILRVPDSYFDTSTIYPNCAYNATSCSTYFVLYSEFGGDASGAYPSDNGFEEWGVELYGVEAATKSGMKFEDLDGDGVKDPDEPGLGEWQITVYDENGGEVASTFTNSSGPYTGTYTFTLQANVTYTVCEVLKDGWVQSYPATDDPGVVDCSGYDDTVTHGPNGYQINLGSGAKDLDNHFGNWRYATKSGMKFEDLNGDGVKDDGEPGLGDWEIRLYDETGAYVSTSTDSTGPVTGTYTFTLQPGMTYTVCEVLEDGWTQSYPPDASDADVVECHGYNNAVTHGPFGYLITLDSGEDDLDNHFGNYLGAGKSGRKFEDLDADGPDISDPGLGGWTIRAYADDGAVAGALDSGDTWVDDATTEGSGAYSLNLDPGSYIICEILQDGWTQSYPTDQTPNSADCSAVDGLGDWGYAITLESSDEELDNDFGNYQPARVRGCKYHDLDKSGSRDAGEPWLAGWQICLTGDGCKTTLGDGCTEPWTVEPGSQYELCEVLQDGWENTDPGDGLCKQTGQLASGADVRLRFGNYRPVVVGGATVAPREVQTLVLRLAIIGLTALLGSAAGLFLWRRRASRP